jgi:sterol desaturase/sphingolipid hydroxylase (fatty acid hydroxylase superfamily)
VHDIVLFALPVFVACMGLEWAWGRWRGRDTYAWGDTLNSLSQGLLSQAVAALTPLIQSGLYALALPHLRLLPEAAWAHPLGWVAAVVLYDFCDYWLHRVSHESALFWAAHAVHHQSEHFNLSTALRQESFYGVMGWPFFLPMALLGVPVEQFLMAGVVVLFYQFWIHTEHIGKLGVLDRLLSTPSNHRVHHAVNPGYLDKNYAAILIVWDRLFGSFAEEVEPCVYGTVKPLDSWNPLWAVGQFYAELWRRVRATPRWSDKLRVIFKNPGWTPPGTAASEPPGPARLTRPRFAPAVPRGDRVAATGVFLLMAAGLIGWLFEADALPLGHNLLAAAALCLGLWAMGALASGRAARRGVLAGAGLFAALLMGVASFAP